VTIKLNQDPRPQDSWRPTATRRMLEHRAQLLARCRKFFAARGVLEVDTPVVVNAAVTDVHIHSARVQLNEATSISSGPGTTRPFFLHSSPEYAMKRLLASGSGDIYQICHVVRGYERGRQHNAEFTLIEWYRQGFTITELMTEVEALVRDLVGAMALSLASERLSYRDAFIRELQLDPFIATESQLAGAASKIGFSGAGHAARDELLELLMGTLVGPHLGHAALTFVHSFPASQAALARLDPEDPQAALRFELYCEGIELANGFQELASAAEQRARFERDNEERRHRGLPTVALDERLLGALEAGLPECAGVAIGFDRTLMVAATAQSIDEVLAFPTERA
jgi:lysyl-tRNA synthetase class 2